jgi:hypothetical protein
MSKNLYILLLLLLLLLLLMTLQPFRLGFSRLFSILILYAVGRTPWMGIGPCQGLCLHTGQHKQNKRTQTSMPRVGFKPATPALQFMS